MKIEIFTLAYNEELLMPYFIKHYKERFQNCELIINVYDNYSTDATALIAGSEGCNVFKYSTNNSVRVDLLMAFKNNIWKTSDADWVIVPDVDEFIEINENDLQRSKIDNIFRCYAYEMVGDTMNPDELIYGVRLGKGFDRTCIFKPKEIKEMNWDMGAHNSAPVGNPCVIWSEFRPLLYHIKYFSRQYLINRYKHLGQRLSTLDKKNGWSYHYLYTSEKIHKIFDDLEKKKKVVRKSRMITQSSATC